MKSIESKIASLEKKWMGIISAYFDNCFKHTFLPSHDFSHHERTWVFAKHLIKELQFNQHTISQSVVEQTFWSVMFHDIGMTKTVSAKHGKESAKLFKHFVQERHLKLKGMDEIIYAIENHDNKDYQLTDNEIYSPYHILTIADDLDAFGHIGIYRNIEVYLLRNIAPEEIPIPVLENLTSRFTNFQHKCHKYSRLHDFHSNRYAQTMQYFENLKQEIHSMDYKSYYFIGHIGVLNYIRELVTNQANIYKVKRDSIDLVHDTELSDFFKNFFAEVKSF